MASGPARNFYNAHSCIPPYAAHHPGWNQPIPALHHTPPTTPPITHHATLAHTKRKEEYSPISAQHPHHNAMPPYTKRTGEEPPIPTQHATPPTTHHTHARHAGERRLKHTMDIKGGGLGDT